VSGRRKSAHASKAQTLTLEARLTIAQAPALHRALIERLESGHAVQIDGSKVVEVDTAALQVLVSAIRAFKARDLEFRLQTCSEVLRQSAALIGVAEALRFDAGGR
jgi:anti-anti-sigma regulatory factor